MGGKEEVAFYLSMLASLTGPIWPKRVFPLNRLWLAKRLLTISLFSAFNMVSLGKSVKVGEERSTYQRLNSMMLV